MHTINSRLFSRKLSAKMAYRRLDVLDFALEVQFRQTVFKLKINMSYMF